MKNKVYGYEMERMPNFAFRMMSFMFKVNDLFNNKTGYLDEFGIKKGFVVVDYGCGPGRYVAKASELVGDDGLVYAVDIQELAVKSIYKIIEKHGLKNVKPVLATGYEVDIPAQSVDLVYALDMFHMIKDTNSFLAGIHKILKINGVLLIENGHQPRELARIKIANSGLWELQKENDKFMIWKRKSK
ncbi:MAG: methyltransferase domain-containing protein [FCB group bacterium]|jgi:ubiquinone/menaquinone biosynthesis C-methylase UbiE